MRGRAFTPVVAFAASAALALGCLSPTLPLPPPDMPEDIGVGSTDGIWEISGTCAPGATVVVFDTNSGRGILVEDRENLGLYQVSLPGKECDLVTVSQATSQLGTDGSTPTEFVLQAFSNGMVTDPQACQ